MFAADVDVALTDRLDARFGFLNARRAVFPSQLWDAPAAPAPRAHAADRVVVGWGGARAHEDDLRAIVPALRGVLARNPQVHVAVMCDAELAQALDGLPSDRLTRTPPGAADEYARFLDGLDIGLHTMETLFHETGDPKFRPSPLLRKYVRAGRVGMKVGKGVYNYNEKGERVS